MDLEIRTKVHGRRATWRAANGPGTRDPSGLARDDCTAVTVVASAPSTAHAQPQWRWPRPARVVVVADVHGAYDELTALLQVAGVVDRELNWSGRDTTLVSLGDLLDRGPSSRKVMDLMMRLQRDAPASGGAVHVVLGNHEAMNLTGDLRYVSAQEYAAFAPDEPDAERAAAYERFAMEQPAGTPAEQLRLAFERRYPPGYFAHRAAFARGRRVRAVALCRCRR